MKKAIKFSAWIIPVLVLTYFSLSIENLDEHRAKSSTVAFNVPDYVQRFWDNDLPLCIEKAPFATELLALLNSNPDQAFEKFGHKLGISKTWYFMVKGTGTIESVDEEFLLVSLSDSLKIKVATDFIFGNAIREGSGKVNINDFLNMTDFNSVSVAINKMAKEKVVTRLKKAAKAGQQIDFAGAFELSEENTELESILLIPVSVKLSDGKAE